MLAEDVGLPLRQKTEHVCPTEYFSLKFYFSTIGICTLYSVFE